MTIRRLRLAIGLAAATCALLGASLAWATVTGPTKVLGGRGNQILPAATPTADYLSWSASRPGSPGLFDAFLRHTGDPKVKLNRSGVAYNGNISGTEAIYQQVTRRQSNIMIYDTGSQTRHAPAGVNTDGWEWGPTIDGTNVLYGRTGGNHSWRILLTDVTGPTTTLLEKHSGRPVRQEVPGQVAGDWATWARYAPRTHHGTVVLYQISIQHADALAVPANKLQYAPAVNPNGDLFYVRSNASSCGRSVVIREAQNGGADIPLTAIPRGYDVGSMVAVDEGGGTTTVYFDRVNCSTGFYDSYKVVVS